MANCEKCKNRIGCENYVPKSTIACENYAEEVQQLKSCPFCGSEARICIEVIGTNCLPLRAYDIIVEWGIGCSNKDCSLSCIELKPLFRRKCDYWVETDGTLKPVKYGEDGRQYVIDAWNRRVNDESR